MIRQAVFRIYCVVVMLNVFAPFAWAEELIGGSYIIEGGLVNTLSGSLQGGSYVLQGDTMTISGVLAGSTYSLNTGYEPTTPFVVPVTPTASGGGGGGGGGGGSSACPGSINPAIVTDVNVGTTVVIDPSFGRSVLFGNTVYTKKTSIRVYPTQTTSYVFGNYSADRLLSTCSVTVAVPGSVAVPKQGSGSCTPFTKRLKIGAVGVEVRRVQSFLRSQGYTVDRSGVFGVRTERAVLQFQKKYITDIVMASGSSNPTGLWYEFTMKKANEITGCTGAVEKNTKKTNPKTTKKKAPALTIISDKVVSSSAEISTCNPFTRNLEIGSIGAEVRRMQKFLIIQGYELDALGIFGLKTKKAVEKFQALHVDEVLTPNGSQKPTGLWYAYTRAKANKIMGCK